MEKTIYDSFQMAQQNERILFEALVESTAYLRFVKSERKARKLSTHTVDDLIVKSESAMRKTMKISQ